MSRESQPIIWLIDENERELRLHQGILQKAIAERGAPIEVNAVAARLHIGDYSDLMADQRTVGFIIDQRLYELRGIDHSGIQLVKHIRSLLPRLPIYILTNHAQSDDFLGDEWNVEDILSKDEMHDAEALKTFIARLVRRIDVHQSLLEGRDARFRELLKKSLREELTADEQQELNDLQFSRTAVIVADEADKLQRLEKALSKLKAFKDSMPRK